MVQRASRAVLFTGAGMSTECGIPDFRSAGGFWTRYKPIQFQEFLASEDTRLEAWRRFFVIRDTFASAEPGPGHRAVANLVARGHVSTVITQNIDDMHARAGVPRERIIEIQRRPVHCHRLFAAGVSGCRISGDRQAQPHAAGDPQPRANRPRWPRRPGDQ
jgi:NAD-dependent deacetylase